MYGNLLKSCGIIEPQEDQELKGSKIGKSKL
jgi:hypothetical protein